MWRKKDVTEAAFEPACAAADLKPHIYVTHDNEDDLLDLYCEVAERLIMDLTDLSFSEREFECYADSWADVKDERGILTLPIGPVVSIDEFAYVDLAGDEQTLTEDTDYIADLIGDRARIMPAPNTFFPALQKRFNAIRVEVTAGFSACPNRVKLLILQLAASWYQTKEVVTDRPLRELPTPVGFTTSLAQIQSWGA